MNYALRQAKFRDPIHQHSASKMKGFKNDDLMPELAQFLALLFLRAHTTTDCWESIFLFDFFCRLIVFLLSQQFNEGWNINLHGTAWYALWIWTLQATVCLG